MGLLFGSGQYLTRTTNLPTGAFTACWWSMLTTDLNTYTPQWMLWQTPSTSNPKYIQCGSTSDGTSMVAEIHNADNNSTGWFDTGVLANVSANAWYFWALTASAFSGAVTLNGYVRAATATALTSGTVSTTWATAFVPDNLHIAHDYYGGRFAGRFAGFKMFNGVLTAAQILAESFRLSPVALDSVRHNYPLYDLTSGVNDYGPGGGTWSVTGTPTNAEGPPVIPYRRKVYIPASYGSPPPPTANRRRRVLLTGSGR